MEIWAFATVLLLFKFFDPLTKATFKTSVANGIVVTPQNITISLFDTLTKSAFKTSVVNGIVGLVNKMETQISFQAFRSKLGGSPPLKSSCKLKT